jgi:hypothetical protein
MINDTMDSLIDMLDSHTREWLLDRSKALHIFGNTKESVFLRAVERKAKALDIPCEVVTKPHHMFYHYTPVVYDTENGSVIPSLSDVSDIDNAQHKGMSCVAEAVYLLLKAQGLIHGNTITIVGRGHSVKGLAEKLIAEDATVTVAHSKTECLLTATQGRDVVIYATPKLDKIISYDTKELVIDLGGCVEHPNWYQCDYTSGIGKLTVSVLLNRFAKR